MTVHFKGVSRHHKKPKAGRLRDTSPPRTMRLAGLRSDQLGICREPQFQCKKRVPFIPPQVSTSLQWGDPGVLTRRQMPTGPSAPPAVVSVAQTGSVENVETPLAPRLSTPTRALKTTPVLKHCSSGHISMASADQETQNQPAEELNHVLMKKAGLRPKQQRNGWKKSEYQRQFDWKSPAAESPLLTAQKMLYSSNRSIPPLKSNPVAMESEYKRSFKGSPLPKGPCLRRDIELNEDLLLKMESIYPEKEKRQHRSLRRKSNPKEKTPRSVQRPLRQKPETPQQQKPVSPKVVRKVKTEYSSNFRPPLQYCYRDGTWVRSRTIEEEGHEWYHEVQELREKAEAYRKRAWGTHFSRQHLNQILSEQNCLWEVSSTSSSSTLTDDDPRSTSSPIIEALDLASVGESASSSGSVSLAASRKSPCNKIELPSSPTLPVEKRKAWDEEVNPCERGVAEITQQRNEQTDDIIGKGNINGHTEEGNKVTDIGVESEQLSHEEESGNSGNEGRLPTPEHKTTLATQRTHHDRTTPTTGGAILVSPPKVKYTKTTRRSEPPLGKTQSPYKHLSCVSVEEKNSKTERVGSCHSLAAGLATVDPIPLREDAWAEVAEPSSDMKPARNTVREKASSTCLIESTPSNANRIHGTLRNSEFQHNGDLKLHRPERISFPSSDCLSDDDLDDRMSQISFQSAASCSMASQILERAQKRKEDFWGKS